MEKTIAKPVDSSSLFPFKSFLDHFSKISPINSSVSSYKIMLFVIYHYFQKIIIIREVCYETCVIPVYI